MNTRKAIEQHSWIKIGAATHQCTKCHVIKNARNTKNIYYYYPSMGSVNTSINPKCK